MEYLKEESFLEKLDELNVAVRVRETLADSIAYMVLKRCGMDDAELAEEIQFPYIHEFNIVAILGYGLAMLVCSVKKLRVDQKMDLKSLLTIASFLFFAVAYAAAICAGSSMLSIASGSETKYMEAIIVKKGKIWYRN